jgi:hypothetical protein
MGTRISGQNIHECKTSEGTGEKNIATVLMGKSVLRSGGIWNRRKVLIGKTRDSNMIETHDLFFRSG